MTDEDSSLLRPVLRAVDIESDLVPSPVRCTLIQPASWSPHQGGHPLVIALHGGGGGQGFAEVLAPLFAAAWRQGTLEPCSVVVPQSGRSFWMDDVRGEQRWEQFLLEHLIPGLGPDLPFDGRVALLGPSMGGLGVLRLAIKYPDRYVAAAALEPGVETAMTWDEVDVRSTGVRTLALFEHFHGSPVDPEHFACQHPPALIAAQAEAVAESGLALYLECGDEDSLGLAEGAELVHRLLQEHHVRHEYHLVLGADHIGHTLGRRFTEAIGFLGRHLGPPEPDAAVDNLRMQLGMPTRKLQRDGATIGLHIRGEGPAVVLVPSLGRTARDFDNLAGRLAQGGYQAVGVDPRGLDNRGLRDDLTLHSLAGDVAAAIERVGNGPVHLVGHALGNRICRTLTADRPDLVTSLTLLAAGGLVEPAAEVSAALRRCFDLDASMDQRRADIALAFFASGVVPQSWVEGWHPAVALAQAAAVGRTKVADWWSATAQHILVIQGLQDTVARPENGRQYVAEIGAVASLVEIDGAGHALLPEQPDRVATELLAFFDHIGDRPNRRL